MNIVILGAGSTGSYLASLLSKDGHNVVVIDKDTKRLERVGEESDVATVCGLSSKWKLLDDLLEDHPDIFLAMTGNDETNLASCAIAKNLGYPKTVARIKELGFLTRSRIDVERLFFVDHIIGAEISAAQDLLKNILHPQNIAIENFANGSIQMRTLLVPDTWKQEQIPIKDLHLPTELIISLIRRKNPPDPDLIIFPHGDDCLFPQDEITLIGEPNSLSQIHKLFNTEEEKIESVIIVGGTSIALRLAYILEKLHIAVRIIERDENRCKELASSLQESTIIHHEGTDLHFLLSQQVQNVDAFVTCTNEDESNILLSLLGKQAGCKHVVSLVSDVTLGPLLRSLRISFAMSEKVHIANEVLTLLHEEKILSISSLCENQAKVLEIKVSADSDLLGLPLADLKEKLPHNLLIAAIENRGRVMIGKGNRILSPNDTVIIVCSPEHIHDLQDLF
jgi:trk system potassium uptake protein TrkA